MIERLARVLKDNPEKLMLFMFPLITLALFVVAAIAWWLIRTYPPGQM